MPSETSQTMTGLILQAYKLSEMKEQDFGVWLGMVAKDFQSGEASKPERPN